MNRVCDVFLAIGHGRTPTGADDPGAVCKKGDVLLKENELAGHVVTVAGRRLRERGFVVRQEKIDNNPAHDPNFVGSVARSKQLRPYTSIEVHFDWSGAPDGGFAVMAENRIGARKVAKAIRRAYRGRGLPLRPNMAETQFYFPKYGEGRALIWECDNVCRADEAERRVIGKALAEGIEKSLPRRARRRARRRRKKG